MIDAFARAEGPPPDRLWRFMRWALAGAFPAIGFGLTISVAVGATEVGTAWLVGWLIDLAQSRGPEEPRRRDLAGARRRRRLLPGAAPGADGPRRRGQRADPRPEPLPAGAVAAEPPHPRPVALLLRRRLRRPHRRQAAADRPRDHRGGLRDRQRPRPRGHRHRRRHARRRRRRPLAGRRHAGLDRQLRGADPPLHAEDPRPLEGARRGPRRRHRPGRRHDHQHRHGQALQPRHAGGPRRARRPRRLPRRDDRLRRRLGRLPLLADAARRLPAGGADRRHADALDAGHRQRRRHRHRRPDLHPPRADVGLGRR